MDILFHIIEKKNLTYTIFLQQILGVICYDFYLPLKVFNFRFGTYQKVNTLIFFLNFFGFYQKVNKLIDNVVIVKYALPNFFLKKGTSTVLVAHFFTTCPHKLKRKNDF